MTTEQEKYINSFHAFNKYIGIEIAKFTPEEAQAYEDSLKSYRDLKNSLDTAREEGREEGRKEERNKRNIEVVKNSTKAGLSIETIVAITGLSKEQIQDIQKEE